MHHGVSVSTIREMRFLKSTDHENIIKLYQIESPESTWHFAMFTLVNYDMKYSQLNPICMVMDYVDHDMWGLLQYAKESKLLMYECDIWVIL